MLRRANYQIESSDQHKLVIRDIGPWDKCPTVTNDADNVVEDLVRMLAGRRLFCYDSEGEFAELMITNEKFCGFGLIKNARTEK